MSDPVTLKCLGGPLDGKVVVIRYDDHGGAEMIVPANDSHSHYLTTGVSAEYVSARVVLPGQAEIVRRLLYRPIYEAHKGPT